MVCFPFSVKKIFRSLCLHIILQLYYSCIQDLLIVLMNYSTIHLCLTLQSKFSKHHIKDETFQNR